MHGTRRISFATIEAGRGIAAVLVVAYHAGKVAANVDYWGAVPFGGAFACGHAGVEFFFVLSGFIIAYVHGGDIGRPARLAQFAARRFDRIYPLYWLVLAPVTLLALAGPQVASLAHVDSAAILASVLLAGPDAHGGVLTVSWTLFHEMLFYAAFALLILDRLAGIMALLLWAGLIVGGTATVPAYVASPLNLLFAAGVAVHVLVGHGAVRNPRRWLAVGLAAFAALALDEVTVSLLAETVRNLGYGLASAVALAGAVERERRRPLAVPRPLRTLGAASYSVYLVHYPALSAVAMVLHRTGLTARLPASVGVLALVVAVVGLGVVVHILIERPLLAGMRRLRSARALSTGTPAAIRRAAPSSS